jgi:hypothetical protein
MTELKIIVEYELKLMHTCINTGKNEDSDLD